MGSLGDWVGGIICFAIKAITETTGEIWMYLCELDYIIISILLTSCLSWVYCTYV